MMKLLGEEPLLAALLRGLVTPSSAPHPRSPEPLTLGALRISHRDLSDALLRCAEGRASPASASFAAASRAEALNTSVALASDALALELLLAALASVSQEYQHLCARASRAPSTPRAAYLSKLARRVARARDHAAALLLKRGVASTDYTRCSTALLERWALRLSSILPDEGDTDSLTNALEDRETVASAAEEGAEEGAEEAKGEPLSASDFFETAALPVPPGLAEASSPPVLADGCLLEEHLERALGAVFRSDAASESKLEGAVAMEILQAALEAAQQRKQEARLSVGTTRADDPDAVWGQGPEALDAPAVKLHVDVFAKAAVRQVTASRAGLKSAALLVLKEVASRYVASLGAQKASLEAELSAAWAGRLQHAKDAEARLRRQMEARIRQAEDEVSSQRRLVSEAAAAYQEEAEQRVNRKLSAAVAAAHAEGAAQALASSATNIRELLEQAQKKWAQETQSAVSLFPRNPPRAGFASSSRASYLSPLRCKSCSHPIPLARDSKQRRGSRSEKRTPRRCPLCTLS
jgi:hypothetical protein